MRHHANALKSAGRFGDTELVHINKRELGYLSDIWGEPSINPTTGLPEFFDFGSLLSWAAPVLVPAALEAFGGAGTLGDIGGFLGAGSEWAPTLGGAITGGLTGALTQGLQGKDALLGGLLGGASGAAVPSAGRALGFTGFETPFNIPTLFDVGSMFGAAGSGLGGVSAASAFDPTKAVAPGNIPKPSDDLMGLPGATGAGSGSADSKGWLGRNPWAVPLAGMGLAALASPKSSTTAPPPSQQQQPTNLRYANYTFPTNRLNRTRNTKDRGVAGEYNFFDDNQVPDVPISLASGGDVMGGGDMGGQQGYIQGPGDGRDDVIKANLSNDEYVLDAETMALLGNGSPSAGADKMDQFRVNLRKHKGAALAKGKYSPDAKPVEGYLS